VTGFSVGDRVAYATGPVGAYATVRTIPAADLVHLPQGISDETAAAAMLKGMTAAFLVGPCARVEAGQTVLVHAAAGGVGSILVPWLVALGVEVIAHAGSPEKAAKATEMGAAHALSCPLDALAEQVRQITSGRGVTTVFDGVGAASWAATLASVAKRGLIVSFGNASGAVPPVAPLALTRAGSVFLTRPTMGDYMQTEGERQSLANALFTRISDGLSIPVGQRFPLVDAAEAHRRMESRSTLGSTVLLP
jgi:NADPH2:quinone reductase